MKKLLSVLLALAFCASFTVNSFAADNDVLGSFSETLGNIGAGIKTFIEDNPAPEVDELFGKLTGSAGSDETDCLKDFVDSIGELVPGIKYEDIKDIIDTILAQLSIESLQRVVQESLDSLNLGNIADFSSIDTDVMPQLMDTIMGLLEENGVDTSGFEEFIQNNELINFFASLYTGGKIETPEEPEPEEPEIPDTGSSSYAGIAALATLSLAAAAFVCLKKKD